jgi:hypothetical protein
MFVYVEGTWAVYCNAGGMADATIIERLRDR